VKPVKIKGIVRVRAVHRFERILPLQELEHLIVIGPILVQDRAHEMQLEIQKQRHLKVESVLAKGLGDYGVEVLVGRGWVRRLTVTDKGLQRQHVCKDECGCRIQKSKAVLGAAMLSNGRNDGL
jgi:hypothetical protein